MTLRNNSVSQLEVCHSDFEVSAGTDIVPIESWQRTGGEADQQPSLLVTQSLNLHTQPSLISEISPTCSLSSMNVCSSCFCSSVTNDCSRKPEAALPALVEPLTIQVHSGYIARTTELIELRDDEFYTVINLSDYSLSNFLICVFYPWVLNLLRTRPMLIVLISKKVYIDSIVISV